MKLDVTPFDCSKHVFHSEAFEEIIKDTIRFFNGTPVYHLPPPESFIGSGVYAIYYIGKSPYYRSLHNLNRIEFKQPIYVGKAVPQGWRQARKRTSGTSSNELFHRLKDHARSISQVDNLDLTDFYCRFMILEEAESDLIGTVEAALIRYYKPVWNSCLDGFGNHDPGKGRYNQARSDWDILHPGRFWAERCSGKSSTLEQVKNNLKTYFLNDE